MSTISSDERTFERFFLAIKAMSLSELVAMKTHIQNDECGHPDQEYARFGLEGLVPNDEFWDALLAEIETRMPHNITC